MICRSCQENTPSLIRRTRIVDKVCRNRKVQQFDSGGCQPEAFDERFRDELDQHARPCHRTKSNKDEMIELLERAGIEFDPKFLE